MTNRFKTLVTHAAKTSGQFAIDQATSHIRSRFDNFFLFAKIILGVGVAAFLLVVSAILLGVFSQARAADYSEGYRMGVVSKFSSKGMITKSWEGQMLMGRDGAPYHVVKDQIKIEVNPWRFSAENGNAQQIQSLVGEYVWIKYREDFITKSLVKDTPYIVVDIQPVTRQEPVAFCQSAKAAPGKSDGVRAGRVVKISNKGAIVKSNEIIFQMGTSGNQYKSMSVSDDQIAQCAINFLKSGKMVKVFYTQSMFNTGLFDDTSYDIYRIEVLKDL